jgi:Gpi18-like mannosyltransferase
LNSQNFMIGTLLREKWRRFTVKFKLSLPSFLTGNLRTVLIIGVLVRLVLAPFFAHPFDMNAWYINGQALLEGKQSLLYYLVPYRISFFLFVFPETWLFNHLAGIFPNYAIPIGALNPKLNPGPQWGISIVPGLLYDFLLKIPLILSDVLVTTLLFKIVKSEWQNEKIAILVAALWFLNPIVIWVSSGWGMFDTLPALFTVLSLYFVLDGRYSYSMLSLAGSTLLKFYAIVIFVPLIFIIWRKAGPRAVWTSLIPTVILAIIASLPLFLISNPLSFISTSPLTASQYAGLSIWTSLWLTVSHPDISILADVLIVTSLFGIYFFLAKNGSRIEDALTSGTCFFLIPVIVLLMFYKFVGENYIVWLIPFSAILTARSLRINRTHWSLSILSFISSITNSLLPYYMLPVSPWIGGFLVSLLGLAAPARVAPNGSTAPGITFGKLFLSTLGIIAFVILLLMLLNSLRIIRKRESQPYERISN